MLKVEFNDVFGNPSVQTFFVGYVLAPRCVLGVNQIYCNSLSISDEN